MCENNNSVDSCSECGGRQGGNMGRTFGRTGRSRAFRVVAFCFVLALVTCSSPVQCSENTLISQSEVKTIEPTNNPTKVFVRRRIFRKLVKDSGSGASSEDPQSTTTTSAPTTSTRPRTLYSLVKRLDSPQSSTVTGNTLKSSMSSSMSLAAKQKFNFQSLKTRLGLAASGIVDSTTTTVQPPSSTTHNASLVMIPLPPSQRKPYTPVIMQVSKSTTAKPEATVQTFKLNKMFVPIGIYGKVVENGTSEPATEPTVTTSSSTPITSIRHKGTDSGEKVKARKHKGIAESVDITYGRPNLDRVSLTTEKPDIGRISITTEVNELFSGMDMFGSGSSNEVRRDGGGGGYGGQQRRKQTFTASSPAGTSGMTLMTPPKLGSPISSEDSLSDGIGSYSSYASYSLPQKNKFHPSSIVDSITDSMSRIPSLVPSLFHKGLTSLASMTSSLKENPFEDDGFDANVGQKKQKPLISNPNRYSTPKIPASVPGGYINGMGGSGNRDQSYAGSSYQATSDLKSSASGATKGSSVDISEYETLEYFRKRPHLLAQLRKERAQEQAWRRSQGVRMSKGFKPVNAPDYLAREYYKSTSTTQVTPEDILTHPTYRSGKKMRGSWLLRNSNEYVANKNDKIVRMWRDMLDSLTADEDEPESTHSNTRRVDENVEEFDHEDPSSSTISARRSSLQQPSNVLTAQWSTIKRKYSKDQIKEAKERILTLLDSGYGDEALHEFADDDDLQHHIDYSGDIHHHDTSSHMPPPPPPRIKTLSLTKGLSGAAAGAFKDLVKFFKLGISVGAGHSKEPVHYEQIADEQEAEEIGGSEWKPVRRPLISFSAGISLKSPSLKKPPHDHHHDIHHDLHHEHHPAVHSDYEDDAPLVSHHYSSSSKPYIPSAYKGLNGYIDELATTHVTSPALKPTPYSYTEDDLDGGHVAPSQSIDYGDEDDTLGYGSAPSSSYAASQSYSNPEVQYGDTAAQYSYDRYTTLRPGSRQRTERPSIADSQDSASSWNPVVPAGVNPNEYELVPSSVYLNGQHDPRDIAAVVKPAGISDELVRSALPAGLRNLRILDYPNQYQGYANSLNTISAQLGKTSKPTAESFTSFKHAMKKLRENYVAKENAYLPPGDLYEEQSQRQVPVPQESSVRGAYSSGVYTTGPLSNIGATYYNPAISQQGGIYQALSGLENGNVFATADRINNLGRGTSVGGLSNVYAQQLQQQQQQVQVPGQKDELGFSTNYNLGSNIDPDIAALLKSELDKDDVPEDVRKEFLEAKEQEKKEQAQKQQQQQAAYQQASRRADETVDLAQQTLIDSLLSSAAKSQQQPSPSFNLQQIHRPPPTAAVPLHQYVPQQQQQRQLPQQQYQPPTHPTPRQYQHQSRAYHLQNSAPPPPVPSVVTTRFFAPIPITPTLMTAALKNPRYASPVPRYVIELAKKLQGDRNVQGIVRVSAKRGRGLPPVEFLYPVKG